MAAPSPPATMRESRMEEKQELQGLNDRLETYVAHSRSLRTALEGKERELEAVRKHMEKHVAALQAEFTVELGKLRDELIKQAAKAADEHDKATALTAEVAGLRAQLVDVRALQAERANLRERLEAAEAAAKAAEQRAAAAEKALKQERLGSSQMAADLKGATTELASARGTLTTLRGELASLRAAYEAATEGANDAIAKAVAKERAAWDKLHAEKLSKLEKELRAEYTAEVADLKQREDAMVAANDRLRRELATAREESQSKQSVTNALMKRISDLQDAHKAETVQWDQTRSAMEDALATAQRGLAVKVDEFNNLMDVKISLQAEIDHYRRILEIEEKQTKLTPSRKVPRREGAATAAESSAKTWLGGLFGTNPTAVQSGTVVTTVSSSSVRAAIEEATEVVVDASEMVAESAAGKRSRGGRRSQAEPAKAGRKRRQSDSAAAADEEAASGAKSKNGAEAEPAEQAYDGPDTAAPELDFEPSAADSSPGRSGRRGRRYPVMKHKRVAGQWITRSMEAAGYSDKSQFSSTDMTVHVNLDDDHVTVNNHLDVEMDLTGWSLLSEVGEQRFAFPDGLKLPPGGSVTVWSGPHSAAKERFPTDLVWSDKYIWNSRGDTAVLFDAEGREVSREVGLPGPVAVAGKTDAEGKPNQCVVM